MLTSLQDVVCVGPRVADILNLPPRSQIMYMVGASTLGFVVHIAAMRGVQKWYKAMNNGKDRLIQDFACSPRQIIPALLRLAISTAAAVGFEWVYANVPVVAKAVAGAVWGMRRAVGLPGTAPYGELSGGTPLANVLTTKLEMEQLAVGYFPIPTIGVMGINAKPLTTEQTAEIFAPVGGNPEGLPLRFLTPTRLVRFALQLSAAKLVLKLFQVYVVPKMTGTVSFKSKPKRWESGVYVLSPLILLSAMAIVRDGESVSVLGTRWRMGLMGVTASIWAITTYVLDFAESLVYPPYVIPGTPREELATIAEDVIDMILPTVPIRYMSNAEAEYIREHFWVATIEAEREGVAPMFWGCLALLAAGLLSTDLINNEPLTAYESSLERINADLADAVMERQASVVSVDGDAPTNETCPICLRDERPVSQDMLRVKSCKHEFHTECLTRWLAQSQECPVCRGAIEHKLSEEAQSALDKWNALSGDEKIETLRTLCGQSLQLILEELVRQDPTNTISSGFLFTMLTNDSLNAIELATKNCTDITTKTLLSSMVKIWNWYHQTSIFLTVGFFLVMITVYAVAPCIPKSLFPRSFRVVTNLYGLPPTTGTVDTIARLAIFAAHLHTFGK